MGTNGSLCLYALCDLSKMAPDHHSSEQLYFQARADSEETMCKSIQLS